MVLQALVGVIASAALGLAMPGVALALARVIAVLFAPDTATVLAGGRKWGLVLAGIGLGTLVLAVLQVWAAQAWRRQ